MRKKIIAILLVAALVCLTGSLSLGAATSGTNSTSGANPANEANSTSTADYWTDIAIEGGNLTHSDIVQFFATEIPKNPYDHVAVYYYINDDADGQNYNWGCYVRREENERYRRYGLMLHINNGLFVIWGCDYPSTLTFDSGRSGEQLVKTYDISTDYGWRVYCMNVSTGISSFITESKLVLKKYGKTHSDGELEGFEALELLGYVYAEP